MKTQTYKEDFDAARDRLTAWWNGEDIGRPAMHVWLPRETPVEQVDVMPEPDGWTSGYSASNYDYRVNLAKRACIGRQYIGEAIPFVSPDLAPNTLALYLGCHGLDQPKTVWCEPCIDSPETAKFEMDPENFYWDFSRRLGAEMVEMGQGRFIVQFPDLIEGLDTLAAMRGTEELLFDLIERPAWVHESLGRITQLYFKYYDVLYDMFKDDRGGSQFWAWAPGRMSKLQCDFSAMISPEMFGEFMVPVLTEQTERLDYSLYHWDGPGALPHHDHLLSIPELDMIQWVPGDGIEPMMDPRWWPLYHKTFEAGKKMFIDGDLEEIKTLKREFGPKLKNFLIQVYPKTQQEADEVMAVVSD